MINMQHLLVNLHWKSQVASCRLQENVTWGIWSLSWSNIFLSRYSTVYRSVGIILQLCVRRLTGNVAHLMVFIHSQSATITGAILSCWHQGITHRITSTHYIHGYFIMLARDRLAYAHIPLQLIPSQPSGQSQTVPFSRGYRFLPSSNPPHTDTEQATSELQGTPRQTDWSLTWLFAVITTKSRRTFAFTVIICTICKLKALETRQHAVETGWTFLFIFERTRSSGEWTGDE